MSGSTAIVERAVTLARTVRQAAAHRMPSNPREPRSGWHGVTICREPQEVFPTGEPPAPFAALGDAVEVQVRKAPGGRGTELRARLRPHPKQNGSSPGGPVDADRLRAALREAKQLIEVGEVLRVDPAPHGPRKHTPTGALVDIATRRAGGGVL